MASDKLTRITDAICEVVCKMNDGECPQFNAVDCKECMLMIAEEIIKNNKEV